MRRPAQQLLLPLLLSLLSTATVAQTYRCTADGRSYYSDRPCAAEPKLQSYGGRDAQVATYTPLPQGAPRAEEHLKYLGSECAAISEAVRTAPARGVRHAEVNALRKDYEAKCAYEDRDARARVNSDRQQQYQEHQARKDADARSQKAAAAQRDRCVGMRDVIAVRRKHASELNAKEQDSLRALEKTFNEVCLNG